MEITYIVNNQRSYGFEFVILIIVHNFTKFLKQSSI